MSLTLEGKAYLKKEMGGEGIPIYGYHPQYREGYKEREGVDLYMDTIHHVVKDIKKGGRVYTYIYGYHPPYREGYKKREGGIPIYGNHPPKREGYKKCSRKNVTHK